jgi:hypothetical protein
LLRRSASRNTGLATHDAVILAQRYAVVAGGAASLQAPRRMGRLRPVADPSRLAAARRAPQDGAGVCDDAVQEKSAATLLGYATAPTLSRPMSSRRTSPAGFAGLNR